MKRIIAILILTLSMIMISILDQTVYAAEPEIIGPDIIYKQSDMILTMSQIKSLYSSSYGAIVVTEDDYTGNGDVPGIYEYTIGVEGQEFIKVAAVSVRLTIGNVIAVTEQDMIYSIHVYKSTILSPQDIIDVLVRIQLIVVNSTTHVTLLTNTYTENASAPGTYNFEFRLATTSGLESTHEVFIRVTNSEELTPEEILVPEHSTDIADIVELVLLAILAVIVFAIAIYRVKKSKKRGKKK